MPEENTGQTITVPAADAPATPQNLIEAANITPSEPSAATPPATPETIPPAGDPATPPAAYHPDSLPEDMRGKTDQETIDNLMAARPQNAPESADDYQFELSGPANDLIENPDEDGGLKVFKEVAHKNGLSQDQANAIFNDFFGQAVDAGMVQKPVDYDAELAKLAPASEADPQKARAASEARLQKSMDVLSGLKTRQVLSDDDYNFAMGFFDSAQGVQVFEKISSQMQVSGIETGGEGGGGAVTKEQLKAMMQDPRYLTGTDKHDPAYRERVDKLGAALYT